MTMADHHVHRREAVIDGGVREKANQSAIMYEESREGKKSNGL